MEKDNEILSSASRGSQSLASQRQNSWIRPTPTQNKTLTLALLSSEKQQGRSSKGGAAVEEGKIVGAKGRHRC
ncbi:hypothetical protein DVH24_006166 [Malus domestica]|uniref:Uncharacterized protein n=1 Tax=Malus domestica TaxID=3750 RepID=A0A498IIN2_MALDO|nr:hypothetical protein DVH24_006166 [Malus domestica]